MSETGSQEPQVPSAEQQIAENGVIDRVPGTEDSTPSEVSSPSREIYFGGYTGRRPGGMAEDINRLRAAGKDEEADALYERFIEAFPPSPAPDKKA